LAIELMREAGLWADKHGRAPSIIATTPPTAAAEGSKKH